MTHWLLVGSAANFEISRARNFDVAGMKDRWRKAALEVRPGDTVFHYLVGLKVIGGETKVMSEAFYDDNNPIWGCTHPGEVYPWRFQTEPVNIRTSHNFLSVQQFIENYEYARRWPAKNWTLAFQGNVHRLSDHDYQLVHGLLAKP